MTIKTIDVEFVGETPLLMNNIGDRAMAQMEKGRTGKKFSDIPSPEDEAEDSAYRNAKGELIIPARCVKACIIGASSWFKIGRRSMKQLVAGSIRVEPFEIPLGTKKYKIDARPVTIGQGNRVIRHRPKLDKWKLSFKILYNDEIFSTKESLQVLKKVIEEAGVRCGLLDNRPAKYGDNGIFKLTRFKVR